MMSERIYVVNVQFDYKLNVPENETSELLTKLREELTTLWHNTWRSESSYHMFTNGVIAIVGRYFMTIETFGRNEVLSEPSLRLKTNDLTYLNYAIEKVKEVVEKGNTWGLRIVVINNGCGDLIEIDMNIVKVKSER
jgi:hypothetical protein